MNIGDSDVFCRLKVEDPSMFLNPHETGPLKQIRKWFSRIGYRGYEIYRNLELVLP